MGTDREPKMLAYGAAKRLSIPMTPEDTLRDLLGDILTPEREQAMRAKGRLEVAYDAGPLGTFQVTFTSREGGFDVVFVRGRARSPAQDACAPPLRTALACRRRLRAAAPLLPAGEDPPTRTRARDSLRWSHAARAG